MSELDLALKILAILVLPIAGWLVSLAIRIEGQRRDIKAITQRHEDYKADCSRRLDRLDHRLEKLNSSVIEWLNSE